MVPLLDIQHRCESGCEPALVEEAIQHEVVIITHAKISRASIMRQTYNIRHASNGRSSTSSSNLFDKTQELSA